VGRFLVRFACGAAGPGTDTSAPQVECCLAPEVAVARRTAGPTNPYAYGVLAAGQVLEGHALCMIKDITIYGLRLQRPR
jgi:hypothetical protein